MSTARVVRAPRGSERSAQSWGAEGALRMLQNNLDPEVAERPEDLVVYGGSGRAARDWRSFDAIVETLRTMGPEDTLLVQSGKPVGVLRTHDMAPRVLIANANIVPKWATPEHFRELEDMGLTMYGQMTAGSWIYIGTQGILQGTYATFAEVAKQHFSSGKQSDSTLAGTWTLTAGLGGMGGAQPLAVTGNGGAVLCIEVDPWRAQRRQEHGYLDEIADSLDDGLARVKAAAKDRRALSVAVVANAADVFPELVRRDITPDIVTDQTSAHDALNGYVPNGMTLEEAVELRKQKPNEYVDRAKAAMAVHCQAMVDFQRKGAVVFDYGNGLRGQAQDAGVKDAFSYPGFVVAYVRPLFSRGAGPFRWACLSGDDADLAATDEAVLKAFPDDDGLQRWVRFAAENVKGQGLPARICWLSYGERHVAGLAFDDLVARGVVRAPIVIGRDHLDAGSVASPERETEAMRDGSDAIADWPLLNALVNTSSGASWVSIHHGGGVGIGKSIHAGVVIVAEGNELSRRKLELVLTNDPGTGVIRHADAGYDIALDTARGVGVRMPLEPGTHAPRGRPRTGMNGDLVVRNIGRLTTWHGPDVEAAAVVIQGGYVSWTGADRLLPVGLPEIEEYDAAGAAVLPGFVDSHTHAIWAGSRRDDFVGRLSGESYQPGGIMTTVKATRAASDAELLALASERIDSMQRNGTTTVEVKSGYGLSVDDEMRILRIAGQLRGPRVIRTYLGAHVVPEGRDRADYLDEVVATIPRAKDTGAQWCDVFCDEGAFSVEEARRILSAAQASGMGTRIHAEQIANTGAAQLAAELGSASADHLDHVTEADARALAGAGVVATLVPVVSLYSRSMRWDHARTLLDAGCTLAIATDCNPGTAWCESMPYAMQLACLAMGLSVETVLRAATLGGAAALRRTDIGNLGIGARGDLVVVNSDHSADLFRHLGAIAISRTVVGGCPIG